MGVPEPRRPGTLKETVSYGGWPNCIRLSNGLVELVITSDVGPRIIRFGFVGGQNLFKEYSDQLGLQGGDEWRPYGGHRLWHAPESIPRTYWPDNVPVAHSWDGKTLILRQEVELSTGLQKELEVVLDPVNPRVSLAHRLINRNLWAIETAPWCLSVMAPGGRAIFPHEPFRPHADYLLPARPLVLWHYTDMADPRWTWGSRYIQLRQDPTASSLQKVGMLNTQGWAAYALDGELFLKRYPYVEGAVYPDFGCNTETFTNAEMLEVETLGPLTRIEPDASVSHAEEWFLYHVALGPDEASLDEALLPRVRETWNG